MTPDETLTIPYWPPVLEDIHDLFETVKRAGERVGEIHMSPETASQLSPNRKLEYVWNAIVVSHPELQREVRVLSYVGNPCAERIYVANLVFQITPP